MNTVLLVMLGTGLGLVILGQWMLCYQLLKRHGTVLLRLDALERSQAAGAAAAAPAGLAVGTPIPPFQLPDLDGRQISSDSFLGQRVLLVHWDPQCGFCELIADELAGLQAEFDRQKLQLILVAHSPVEPNRRLADEAGLKCPILLLNDGAWKLFDGLGTPAAYLIDPEGRVARPLAVGADQVPVLAREAVAATPRTKRLPGERPLSESRIERQGIKAGTPAPLFRLPDLSGRPVALELLRGRPVLLVFSDPHCGPCDQLAPQLVRLDRQHHDHGLAIVMVSRGDLDENRRKARQFGFEFPVVIQDRWKLSKQYGIFASPVAFLIDEAGVIVHPVARGVDDILALASAPRQVVNRISP